MEFPSSPSPARITIRDLAKRLGLSHAAVSMALRDHPNIAAKTRQRVKTEAELCGYRPEPMLSALAAYRQMKKPSVYHGTLAWLFDNASREQLFSTPLFKLYFEGACWRAASLGFQVEEFGLSELGVTPARMSNILLSRGIQGVLLAPLAQPHSRLKMQWDWFSSVTFGFSLLEPQLHLVISTQYRIGMAITHKLQDLGYKRVGFFGSKVFDERTDQNFTAGFHIASMRVPVDQRVPPLLIGQVSTNQETRAAMREWVTRWKVDAIVSTSGMQDILIAAGYRIPEDLAVALIGYEGIRPEFAGMDEQGFRTGAAAVDCVVGMIHRGERGVPDVPYRLLIEGRWMDGPSAPPASTTGRGEPSNAKVRDRASSTAPARRRHGAKNQATSREVTPL